MLEVRDGQSGLELFRSRRIDCIITELYLPDMSGYEFLIKVVPDANKPTIAVVMLTRTVWKTLKDIALQHGAQAFLVKRFTAGDELVTVIQKAIATVEPTRKDQRG